jgi:glycosyltransferase involved in cell wall biosynthesis
MHDAVTREDVLTSKISVILNYSARKIEILNKIEARSRFGWGADEFILIHTGNMGAKQDLENVVAAAEILKIDEKLRIFLVGHGNQEAKIKELCHGKLNISVIPAVKDVDYSALLSAADLLLVNERSTQLEMSLPSKLASYLKSERPVIAAVPRSGATWKFLDGVAELVEAGDPVALAQAIEELKRQPQKLVDLARRGSDFAQSNLDPDVGRKKYLDWIERLVNIE